MAREGPLQAPAADAWRAATKRFTERVGGAITGGALALAPEAAVVRDAASDARARALPTSPAWPTAGELLLLRLARAAFPATDFRHPILAPLELGAAQALAQTPIASEGDLAAGVATAAALLELIAPARRFFPEIPVFLTSVITAMGGGAGGGGAGAAAAVEAQPSFRLLASAAPTDASALPPLLALALRGEEEAGGEVRGVPLSLLAPDAPRGARASRGVVAAGALRGALAALAALTDLLVPPAFLAAESEARRALAAGAAAPASNAGLALGGSAAAAAIRARARARGGGGGGGGVPLVPLTETSAPILAAPEILDGAADALARLLAAGAGPLRAAGVKPPPLLHAVRAALSRVVAARDAVAAARGALRFGEEVAGPRGIRMLTPLLEDVPGSGKVGAPGLAARDEDAEAARAKAEARGLQRQLKREKRGASRELRLDRAFVVKAKDGVAATRDAERSATLKGLMSDLQRQQGE
jgi:hypothetical protein